MLDIPPPPRATTTSSTSQAPQRDASGSTKPETDGEDDIVIVPSSDEEYAAARSTTSLTSRPVGSTGGWKLIPRRRAKQSPEKKVLDNGSAKGSTTKHAAKEMARSKSSVDRRRTLGVGGQADLSPVTETNPSPEDIVLGAGAASVVRSRTLPTKASPEKEKDRVLNHNVLKKARRSRPISTGVGVGGATLRENSLLPSQDS